MEKKVSEVVNEKLAKTELDYKLLENNIGKIYYTLDKAYLNHLYDYCVLNFDKYCELNKCDYKKGDDPHPGFFLLKVNNFIINKDEKVIDCMKNLIGTFSNTVDSIGLLFQRKIDSVDVYFVFKKFGESNPTNTNEGLTLLEKSFKGNFPGSAVELINNNKNALEEIKFLKESSSISMLSSVPSDKSEDYISQGIEKLLNGVVPTKKDEEYSVLILAESMTQESIRDVINGFEEMATAITPYASHQFQAGKNDSESNGEMQSITDTKGVSHAVSKTHSINLGVSLGGSNSFSNGISSSTTNSINAGAGASVGFCGTAVNAFVSTGKSLTSGVVSSIAKMLSLGVSGGYGYSWGKIDTKINSNSLTDGTNHNITVGKSENTTYTYKSYLVTDLIQNLEKTIQRLVESKSTGLWKTATYVFSKADSTSISVASYLKGLSQGDNSYIENPNIITWNKEDHSDYFDQIRDFISYFIHPIFIHNEELKEPEEIKNKIIEKFNEEIENNDKLTSDEKEQRKKEFKSKIGEDDIKIDLVPVTPTTNISTTELAKIFSLPTHALPGLPVLECAEFGRNVASYDKEPKLSDPHLEEDAKYKNKQRKITLGKIYHMHQSEKLDVDLTVNSFSSHIFITGSTGSGKSNTIYQIINKLKKEEIHKVGDSNSCSKNKVKFLVIEPAKGEYKNVFGQDENKKDVCDVHVYGTNPSISNLLRINPFSFPNGNDDVTKNIHILEHLDRLVEIFNVCWPMYAAMPAVLKEAVEKAYEDCGWNLTKSTNEYGKDLYPTFADVTRNIRTIIDSSEYDAENKGAYKGALITRLKSLSNGINGLVFTTNEISNKDLFDKNVVVDLSRVGSSETKSLIMGLLVLKLQEYRMTSGEMNAPLKHVTVLEEAHNILKRTSTEQSQDSGNLLGKSVEMLTNAIAEMRTYGEGFIIADQAPGLLDMAVIRNTNTKIIMRLPDLGDRQLVGKAANLNDNQIDELAKLPTGVAAVYQNNWVQPVLCKVDHYKDEKHGNFKPKQDETHEVSLNNRIDLVKKICFQLSEINETDENLLKKVSGVTFFSYKQYKDSQKIKPNYDKLSYIVSSLLPEFTKTLKDSALKNPSKVELWRNDLQEHIEIILKNNKQFEIELRNSILQCVLQNYILGELNKPSLLNELLNRKVQ